MNRSSASTRRLKRTQSLSWWHKIGSLAFASNTVTSKNGIGQISHLGSIMSTCVGWLTMIRSRQHVRLWKQLGYHNQLWKSTWGQLALYTSSPGGCPPADRGAKSVPHRGSRLAVVFQAYQDRTPLHRRRRSEVYSVHQLSLQTVVVLTQWTSEIDSWAWVPTEEVLLSGRPKPCGGLTFCQSTPAVLHVCTANSWIAREVRFKQAPKLWPVPPPARQRQTSHCKPHLPAAARAEKGKDHPVTVHPRPYSLRLSFVFFPGQRPGIHKNILRRWPESVAEGVLCPQAQNLLSW